VMTTSEGIMDHVEARQKHLAGKILRFFFWTKQTYNFVHTSFKFACYSRPF
jgi:hypothetical protein